MPEGARVLPSGGDTDRMAELFKQAGVTTIAEFNAKQKALGFGLPNERERKPPPKASQAEIDEVYLYYSRCPGAPPGDPRDPRLPRPH